MGSLVKGEQQQNGKAAGEPACCWEGNPDRGAGGSGRYNFSPVAIRKGEREDREEQKRTKYFERKKPQV